MVFIETSEFSKWVGKWLTDETYAQLQNKLQSHPNIGNVMPRCGGLRKVRVSDPRRGKGKRGGIRVIYLHVPEVEWIFMLDIYGKGEKDDLNAEEKKALAQLAKQLKDEAIANRTRTAKSNFHEK